MHMTSRTRMSKSSPPAAVVGDRCTQGISAAQRRIRRRGNPALVQPQQNLLVQRIASGLIPIAGVERKHQCRSTSDELKAGRRLNQYGQIARLLPRFARSSARTSRRRARAWTSRSSAHGSSARAAHRIRSASANLRRYPARRGFWRYSGVSEERAPGAPPHRARARSQLQTARIATCESPAQPNQPVPMPVSFGRRSAPGRPTRRLRRRRGATALRPRPGSARASSGSTAPLLTVPALAMMHAG